MKISQSSYLSVILIITFILITTACALAQTSPDRPLQLRYAIASGDWGTLWACGPTCRVLRDEAIPNSRWGGIYLNAAGNEFEPFQLVLHPNKRLEEVTVTPHRLKSPEKNEIGAWNIDVRNVGYIPFIDPGSAAPEGARVGYPDPLPSYAPFAAPELQNSPVWISVYVPPNTPAGVYAGSVSISAKGMKKINVPLKVNVRNFELPTVSTLRTAYDRNMEQVAECQGATTLEQKRKLTELYNRDFWRHRVSPLKPYAFYPIDVELDGGRILLDFTAFDTAIANYFHYFDSFMIPGFSAVDDLGLDMGADYERLKIDYMRAVAEHLVNKGHLRNGYAWLMDNPTEEELDSLRHAAQLVDLADPRISVLVTRYYNPALSNLVDIWAPSVPDYLALGSQAPLADNTTSVSHPNGEGVWWWVDSRNNFNWYPLNPAIQPPTQYRVIPWMAWRYGVSGLFYGSSGCEPYPSATTEALAQDTKLAGLYYCHCSETNGAFTASGPVPSIRWEITREGLEDYEYLHILQSKLAQAESGDAPAETIEEARNALEMARSVNARDVSEEQLVKARLQVADAIERLNTTANK